MRSDAFPPIASVLALFGLLVGCSGPADETPPPLNILLISIDTLRADHLGSYGYDRPTSPQLDRFAERSMRYTRARSPAPWTLPSHVGLLTGRHPHEIGIRHFKSALPDFVDLLAEQLNDGGFQTAAFVDSGRRGFVGAGRGFDRGFDHYQHAPFVDEPAYRFDAEATVDAAQNWLADRDSRRPFFLFLHTKSVHTVPPLLDAAEGSDAPYHKPAAFRTLFLRNGKQRFSWTDPEQGPGVHYLQTLNRRIANGTFRAANVAPERVEELIAFYDGGIAYTDQAIGRLLDWLDVQGLSKNTLIVITSDHGEAFGEQELFLHKEVFEHLLHIPLLVHDPVAEPGTVTDPVSLMDVAPTILKKAGLPIPAGMSGVPLPDRNGTGEHRLAWASYESEKEKIYHAGALIDAPWKLVMRKLGEGPVRMELFHLGTDPGETEPRSDEPERTERMSAALSAWMTAPAASEERTLDLNRETLEQLNALGYGQ